MNTIYIYHKKNKLLLLVLYSILPLIGSIRALNVWMSGRESMGVGLFGCLSLPLVILGIIFFGKNLLHKGYVYAITKEGITDSKNRFYAWAEFQEIVIQKMPGGIVKVCLKLRNPEQRYFKNFKILPNRRFLVLDVSLLYAEQIDTFYSDVKKIPNLLKEHYE